MREPEILFEKACDRCGDVLPNDFKHFRRKSCGKVSPIENDYIDNLCLGCRRKQDEIDRERYRAKYPKDRYKEAEHSPRRDNPEDYTRYMMNNPQYFYELWGVIATEESCKRMWAECEKIRERWGLDI